MMKKWKVKKVLIIISIIVICFGIVIGLSVSNELENALTNENIYVDGSNFSGLVQVGGTIVSKLFIVVFIIYSIFIDVLIWSVYGIILIIKKIIKKITDKKVV